MTPNRTLLAAGGALFLWGLKRATDLQALHWLSGRTVVITGGARGLGFVLARHCLHYGANVAICARSKEFLSAAEEQLSLDFHDPSLTVSRCDVTNSEEVAKFVADVVERFGGIDLLINNAGVIQVGPWNTMLRKDYEESIATHFWGPYNTIEAAWETLCERRGRVVNIASIGGKLSVPHLLPYSAGKFALVGFSEGQSAELAAEGVSVTTVSPGLMRTGSPRNAWFKGQHRKEYAWFSIGGSLPLLTIGAEEAARRILIAGIRRKTSVVFPWSARIPVIIHGFAPGVTTAVLGWMNRLLPDRGGIERQRVRGSKSESAWSPSLLTALNERAAVTNNEAG